MNRRTTRQTRSDEEMAPLRRKRGNSGDPETLVGPRRRGTFAEVEAAVLAEWPTAVGHGAVVGRSWTVGSEAMLTDEAWPGQRSVVAEAWPGRLNGDQWWFRVLTRPARDIS